ncbi:MAG: TIGR03084 family metal-binding protein [Jatrophihabitantaceae bacterium]
MAQLDPIAALNAECDALDGILGNLGRYEWNLQTPAPGWTISHQVAHLAATFQLAGLAASDPEAFKAGLAGAADRSFDANVLLALKRYLNDPPEVLLRRWQAERADASKALAAVAQDQLLPWLVNPIPPPVLVAAGMMEAFAHGQDIADTVGVRPERTDRIRVLVEFAVRTWSFGYLARGETVPEVEFRFELVSPSGQGWTFGPADASERITGAAVDFCLLATRRRHRADLELTATGDQADHWMDIAQCYRGTAGAGRRPGQFTD